MFPQSMTWNKWNIILLLPLFRLISLLQLCCNCRNSVLYFFSFFSFHLFILFYWYLFFHLSKFPYWAVIYLFSFWPQVYFKLFNSCISILGAYQVLKNVTSNICWYQHISNMNGLTRLKTKDLRTYLYASFLFVCKKRIAFYRVEVSF